MSQVNLDHRITGEETEEFEMSDQSPLDLSVSVNGITDRGTALANLLLLYYDSQSQREPDSRTVYFALNAIIMELTDVQKTVEAYALANKPAKQA